jgi:hypothetical protein
VVRSFSFVAHNGLGEDASPVRSGNPLRSGNPY